MPEAPLAGLKVLELARILAGPWIGQTLADLGADVIKVESPNGDDTRQWGPPFVEKGDDRSAAYFHACNRGKKSIIADFSKAEDLEKVKALAADADVLVENFKLGGLEKFGLDYSSLSDVNSRLVYCSVTGFGQDGPYAERPGYDLLIQGMSGVMDITGSPDGPPQKLGVAFVDIFTGLYSVIGIQSALAMRERTGKGQHIDMSLFDSMVGVLANQNMNYLTTGSTPKRMGNAHPNLTPYQTFEASDGHIIIASGNDAQYQRLCGTLDLIELASDERFVGNAARVKNRKALTELLEAATKQKTRAQLLEEIKAAGVPCGPINTVGEALDDPQIEHRGMKIEPEGLKGVRTPIRFSDAELKLERGSPGLGEHNDLGWD
ncbi:CoA transferase [Alphaproteobacteria bacterium]|jgi:crotonobetainyl-CoA:carnitine CoA-transferase CaiB-like acyl-CoA transferase|nr:CoA transferase [Alphaproteobacteria bacterium]